MAGKHGGGAWKVAYADFVTAMMAFFMVMWLTAQKPEVKEAVAGYFRDPYAIFQGQESGHGAAATPTEDPKQGHNAESQKRRLAHTGDDVGYQFTVVFPESSADLDAAALEMIRTFAPTLVGKLNRVDVRAHSQSKPLPPDSRFKNIWDLCYARARAVQDELERLGVEADRFRLGQAGANEPLATNLSEAELALNARVDVILLPELVETPWQQSNAQADAGPAPDPQADDEAASHSDSSDEHAKPYSDPADAPDDAAAHGDAHDPPVATDAHNDPPAEH
jgi:chemotaxis protein MotB